MIVRPYQPDDLPLLREMHSGHKFSFPLNIEDYLIVVDDLGRPILAAGAKLVPEITLLCAAAPHPLVKLRGISLLHQALRDKLGGKFTEAHAFLEPDSEKAFSRHLQRIFHWRETWKCLTVKIGDR